METTNILERFPDVEYATRNDVVEAAKAIHDELRGQMERIAAQGLAEIKKAYEDRVRAFEAAARASMDGLQQILRAMPPPVVNVTVAQQPVKKTLTYDNAGRPVEILEHPMPPITNHLNPV